CSTVVGAGPVHSSLLLSNGLLAVLSWDEKTRRLELLEQKPGEVLASRTLVTLCDGTTTVALLPSPDQSSGGDPTSGLFFLYDEAKVLGGGKTSYELSLLVPGWGGARYRRIVLDAGVQPISDFSAVEVADTLSVLILRDSLKILRMKLPR
ncbi:MAG TPA: hypothetical protein VL354_11750, partial [Spirochaetia bacterium]|nr:hypothetical protein [Spirochaetia bacterium]